MKKGKTRLSHPFLWFIDFRLSFEGIPRRVMRCREQKPTVRFFLPILAEQHPDHIR